MYCKQQSTTKGTGDHHCHGYEDRKPTDEKLKTSSSSSSSRTENIIPVTFLAVAMTSARIRSWLNLSPGTSRDQSLLHIVVEIRELLWQIEAGKFWRPFYKRLIFPLSLKVSRGHSSKMCYVS